MAKVAEKPNGDALRVLAEAIQDVGALVRVSAIVADKIQPSMAGHELIALLDRRLAAVSEQLGKVG